MRHGKSSWEFSVSDKERPLKPRGKRDALLVANEFVKFSEIPHKFYSSPAKRAQNTAKIFANTIGFSIQNLQIIDELYDFGGNNVISFVKKLPNLINSVMIFGHNHAFTNITNIFGDQSIDNLPTSGLVTIEFEIECWSDLKKGRTKRIIIPKNLR
jgi:phosphohistidine phosphatase